MGGELIPKPDKGYWIILQISVIFAFNRPSPEITITNVTYLEPLFDPSPHCSHVVDSCVFP